MNANNFRTVWIAAAAGFAAGMLSGVPSTVRAQPGGWLNSVTARNFVLVDEHGHKRAELAMRDGKPILQFYDEGGRITWSAPGQPRIVPLHE